MDYDYEKSRQLLRPEAKWLLFEKLGYKVYHEEVRRFHNSTARVRVCCAPSRSTKSYSSAHELIPSILRPGTTNWIVGPSYNLAEKEFRIIHQKLVIERKKLDLPKPVTCLTNARSGQLLIRWGPPWDSVLEGKSADRPDSLLGEAVDAVIYSEGAQLPRAIRERYMMQRVITRRGIEIIPTTPSEAAEWVHELYELGYSGKEKEIESFHWDVSANPEYQMEDYERAKRLYGEDSPMFREQFLGEFAYYGGRVYPTFQKESHVIEPFDIPSGWERYRAIDFGHRDPFVCLWAAIGPQGEIYLYREYYNRVGASIREHAAAIKRMTANEHVSLTIGDPSAAQSIDDLCFEGISCISGNNDRLAGRQRMMEYISQDKDGAVPISMQGTEEAKNRGEWARLYVFGNCVETIREFMHYRWKEGRQIEKDVEKTEGEDHAMDPLRYLIMERPSPFKQYRQGKPGSWDYFRKKMSSLKRLGGHIHAHA